MRKIPNKDYERLVELIGEFNEARAEIESIVSRLRDKAEAYADARSKKWQYSEAGDIYNDWIESLNEILEFASDEISIPSQSPYKA